MAIIIQVQEKEPENLTCKLTMRGKGAHHSSTLAWKILWTEEPGGLLSMGSQSQTRLKRLSSSHSENTMGK